MSTRKAFVKIFRERYDPRLKVHIIMKRREWAYVRHYTDSEERDRQLSPWLDYYNFARPHGSLGYAPPISRTVPKGTKC